MPRSPLFVSVRIRSAEHFSALFHPSWMPSTVFVNLAHVFRSTSFRILFLVRIQLCALHPFWCPFSPSASEIFRAASPLSLQNLDEFAGSKGRRMKKIDNFIKEREKTLLFLGEDRNAFWLVRCTTKARKERSFANQHQRIRRAVMAKAYVLPQPLSFLFVSR